MLRQVNQQLMRQSELLLLAARNAPKYDKLAEDAVNMRSKEKIAAMKAEQEVALAGIKAKSDVKSHEIKNQAMMKRDKAKA